MMPAIPNFSLSNQDAELKQLAGEAFEIIDGSFRPGEDFCRDWFIIGYIMGVAMFGGHDGGSLAN